MCLDSSLPDQIQAETLVLGAHLTEGRLLLRSDAHFCHPPEPLVQVKKPMLPRPKARGRRTAAPRKRAGPESKRSRSEDDGLLDLLEEKPAETTENMP